MTVVLAVVFFLLGAEAQNYALRYNSTTFPGRVITNSGREECPPAEQLEAVRGEVQTNVSALLRTLTFDASFNVSQYCGSGAWTRTVYINMTNTSQQCPGTFREYSSPVRTCGRRTGPASCDSATFSVNGARYSRVCGRVIAYQIGHPDAFYGGLVQGQSIDGYYVDGVSITHGSPRQHIWSFAGSPAETYTSQSTVLCPCSNTGVTSPNPPTFVGNDYFCETANNGSCCPSGHFFAGDPLFDGQGCGSTSTCCSFNNPPWFSKQLPTPTTDSIEVRVCDQQSTSTDDTPFQIIELYIQ